MYDAVWEKVFTSQAWGKYPSEELIRFVARNFYNRSHRHEVRFLEVGCGPGANIWFLAREGFSFAGIDGSPFAIEQAKARLDKEIPDWEARGSLQVGEIETLPFQAAQFDAVIDHECVCCNGYQSSVRIYQEMARVLKAGGKFFSRTFEQGSWGDQTGAQLEDHYFLVAQGPLAGKGAARFTAINTVTALVDSSIHIDAIERITRTEQARQHEIKELLILGTKFNEQSGT
jgi:SAM-dependent methyltransferase